MPRHSLRTYRRIHKFDHAGDVERGKIHRQTGTYLKQQQDSHHLMDEVLRNPDDESLLEQVETAEHKALKEYRGAKGHKRRLKDLEQQGLE